MPVIIPAADDAAGLSAKYARRPMKQRRKYL